MDDVDPEPWGATTSAERAWAAAVQAAAAAASAAWPFDPVADALAARRLLALPGERAEAALRLRTWREAEGARLARAGLRLAVHGGASVAALARERFGASAPLAQVDQPEAALRLAAAPGVVAVLDAAAPATWWARLLATPELQVVARLPDTGPGAGAGSVLAVARAAPGPTGGDETYWVTDAPGSAAATAQRLGELGLAADAVAASGGLKLMALAGYVQPHDERLARAPGRLTGVVGAAPLPLLP